MSLHLLHPWFTVIAGSVSVVAALLSVAIALHIKLLIGRVRDDSQLRRARKELDREESAAIAHARAVLNRPLDLGEWMT